MPGAVVGEDGLGHEGGRQPVGPGHALHHVLVEHQLVRHGRQGVESHVDLGLSGGAHLVVLDLDLDAELLHREDHLGAQVLKMVHRRNREVPLFVAGLEAQVGPLVRAGVPDSLDRIDLVETLVRVLIEADVVEDEELRLRPEVGGVRYPGGDQVVLGLLGHVAGITGIRLPGDRVPDETVHVERLVLAEGVDHGRVGIRHQQHVGLLDLLEAADRRAVEPGTLLEALQGELVRRQRVVLHQAGQVGEAKIDDLDAFGLDQAQDLFRRALGESHLTSWWYAAAAVLRCRTSESCRRAGRRARPATGRSAGDSRGTALPAG